MAAVALDAASEGEVTSSSHKHLTRSNSGRSLLTPLAAQRTPVAGATGVLLLLMLLHRSARRCATTPVHLQEVDTRGDGEEGVRTQSVVIRACLL